MDIKPNHRRNESETVLSHQSEASDSFFSSREEEHSSDRKNRFLDWLKNRYEKKQGFTIKDKTFIEAAKVFWDQKKIYTMIPQSRVGASLVALNGRVWLYGGKGLANFDDIYSFSPNIGEWTKISLANASERPPEKRLGHVAWTYKN